MQKLQYVFMALAALCFAIPAFADGGSAVINLAPIGVGLGMGLAAGLCGLGQGKAIGSTTEALARNPGTRAALMTFLIIGLAFIESLTLLTFAMIIIKIKEGDFKQNKSGSAPPGGAVVHLRRRSLPAALSRAPPARAQHLDGLPV